MNLIKFINTCDDKSYNNLRNIFTNPPYNLNVKEDIDFPNLYMICYNRDNYNNEISFIHECRGIILEKETNKIICYTLPKINNIDITDNDLNTLITNSIKENFEIVNDFEWDNIRVEESIDGTHIRLFFYNNKWCVSTSRTIDALKSKWGNRKSYYKMFYEAYEHCKTDKFNLDNLDKTVCYGFVLQHPENDIVVEYIAPKLIHIVSRSLKAVDNYKEINIDIDCKKPTKYEIDNFTRLLKICYLEDDFESEGYIIKTVNNDRHKIKSLNYINYKKLKGNYNNELFHYFVLRKTLQIQEYLYKFPKNLDKYNLFEKYFRKMVKTIHDQYMNKFVFKVQEDVNKNYYPTIKNVHNKYKSGEIDRTKKTHIINELLNLDTKLLYTIFKKYMENDVSDTEREYILSHQ